MQDLQQQNSQPQKMIKNEKIAYVTSKQNTKKKKKERTLDVISSFPILEKTNALFCL